MKRKSSSGRVLIVALVLASAALAVARLSRGSSCPPCWMVHLTGKLVEVRQDEQVLPPDAPVFSHLPSVVRVQSDSYRVDSPGVKVTDCYDSTYESTFVVGAR
jgi:hypothetical protein